MQKNKKSGRGPTLFHTTVCTRCWVLSCFFHFSMEAHFHHTIKKSQNCEIQTLFWVYISILFFFFFLRIKLRSLLIVIYFFLWIQSLYLAIKKNKKWFRNFSELQVYISQFCFFFLVIPSLHLSSDCFFFFFFLSQNSEFICHNLDLFSEFQVCISEFWLFSSPSSYNSVFTSHNSDFFLWIPSLHLKIQILLFLLISSEEFWVYISQFRLFRWISSLHLGTLTLFFFLHGILSLYIFFFSDFQVCILGFWLFFFSEFWVYLSQFGLFLGIPSLYIGIMTLFFSFFVEFWVYISQFCLFSPQNSEFIFHNSVIFFISEFRVYISQFWV